MRRMFLAFLTMALTANIMAQGQTEVSVAQLGALSQTNQHRRVSIHDPSVVHSGNDYYLFGTMRGWGRSTDHMQNWTSLDTRNYFGVLNSVGKAVAADLDKVFVTNETKTVKALVGGMVQEVPFGNFNAMDWARGGQDSWNINYNIWAPDVIYNPTMKKWMMYYSVNGDAWHSVIVLLTADDITGPYVYQGPVAYSGFLNGTDPNISWKKTDLELVIGEQATLPARYNRGGDWGTYWPNNIDPCVFYDEEGTLWMSYGSWFGGIFMLKLDGETGLRDYTTTYPVENDDAGRAVSDPYFGQRIAGGYWSGGEGSYIKHIGDYYYLFVSYGGYLPGGGYEMRIFRSASPTGPYLDATNHDALYRNRYWSNTGPDAQTNGGMKLLGAYSGWGFMTVGEREQGHNSVAVDEEGRAFVIYHTKFHDGNPEGNHHQVRVHQLFTNEDGWLCAAPFEYDGETENDDSLARRCLYTNKEIVGTYDILIHKYRMDHANFEEVTPRQITLNEGGSVTGDYTGRWSMRDGTGYITVTLGGVAYKGVVIQQQVDGYKYKAVCFTGTAASGVSLWGWKMEPLSAIAYNYKNYTVPVRANATISKNIPFAATGKYGAVIEWESSEPDVISNTGKYNPRDTDTPVTLTCRISCGPYVYERQYQVTASHATEPEGDAYSGIVAYYDFNEKPTLNHYAEGQQATYSRIGSSTSAPALQEDMDRFGKVVHQYEGAARANSYVRMPNPLAGLADLDGFTISLWVRRAVADDLTGTLWAFTDKMGQLITVSQRLFMTGNAFVGFESGDNSFSLNKPNDAGTNPTNYIPAGQWALVTLTVSREEGLTLYINGLRRSHKSFTSTAGSASTTTAAAKLFDYQHVLDFIAEAGYLQLGVGSSYGSAEASFDDLLVYNRALESLDVRALNTLLNRVNDFTPTHTAITDVHIRQRPTTSIYDLVGRRVSNGSIPLRPGLYIVGGKKILMK